MKKFKKFLSIVVVLAMAVTTLTACGSGEPAGNANAIKIGAIGPITGGAAIYGQAVKNGAEIAVEEVNALGGIQFELKYQDDENDAENQ